jgi:thiol:disulfide interchange protein
MKSKFLDTWTDAANIATTLSRASSKLVIAVGAENWCEKCRTFRIVLEAVAHQNTWENTVWLWLDLDEHAEFLSDFIPENLPLLVIYKGERLTHSAYPGNSTAQSLAAFLAEPTHLEQTDLPDIRARLISSNWAI